MARGDLMKKLLASYGRDAEFRSIAEQIIGEEERKNNWALAKSLRKSLEHTTSKRSAPKALAPLLPFPEAASDFIELVEPRYTRHDIVLSPANARLLLGLMKEFRHGDEVRRHGLPVRSKLLFCGPPGCGKTLCAEIFSAEMGLPLFVAKLDRLISSYLGETATNIRKIFEFARKQPCVLFFDEFDALARARNDGGEHNELRRVVNSLLLFIDRLQPKGFLVAASNLDNSLDEAVWRRFDEVLWFDKPNRAMTERFLRMKFRNVPVTFDLASKIDAVQDYSYAELGRICVQAIKSMILERHREVRERDFDRAILDESHRRAGKGRVKSAK